MSLAILCSGQGLQHPGMFALTGDAPEAADLFVQATALLDGHDPRELVSSLSAAALHENRIGQFLCTIQALAAKAALCDVWLNNFLVAGYSVGEVAAWGVAGLTSPSTTLELIRRRADAMDAAKSPGEGLLSVRGLSRDTIQKLCTYRDAAISIVNPDDAFVIGGTDEALHAIASDARNLGASRIVRVAVNVAFHTARLSAASEEFRKVLLQTPIKKPGAGARLFSGIDGQAVLDISAGIEKLATQISHTVQWAACLESCVEAGASAFLELGPGRALSQMVAKTYPDIPARSLEDFKTLQGVRKWLDRS